MEQIGFGSPTGPGEARELSEVYSSFTYFAEGDVLVAKITPSFENGKGAIGSGLRSGIGLGTTELHVLRPRKIHAPYLNWLVQSRPFRHDGTVTMTGAAGQQRVPEDFIADFRVPVDNASRQRTIATFLDRETERIDALIDRKRRLIDLLEEKRTATITHAVTKGLDPTVPLKPPGIPWIGDIPGHWEEVRLMHLTPPDRKIMYGIVLPGPNVEQGVPIIKSGNVKPGRLDPDLLDRTTFEIEKRNVKSRVYPGDIIYSIRGSVGDAEIVPDDLEMANLTQDAARVVSSGAVTQWLVYVLRCEALFSQLESKMTGSAVKGINIRDLKRLRIPLPSVEEQESIAGYLTTQIGAIERLERTITAQLALLAEYREALITAAVTGEIDVDTFDNHRHMEGATA